MLALKDVAAVKVAVEISNNGQLKKEILCVHGSDYDAKKSEVNYFDRKRLWDELLEKKAGIILKNLCLTEHLQEKVIGVVFLIGTRILSWAEYHERTLGLTRNYCFSFLNSSFFTVRGIVNCKKTAEEWMKDISLSIKQKYKLALLYCMDEQIPALYNQMAEEDKLDFYNSENPSSITQPHFVKFWSYYLKDDVDKLRGDTDPNLYWLQMAVKSGSKDVVEYCLQKTNLITDDGALIHAALEAVRCKMKGWMDWTVFENDWEDDAWIHDDGINDMFKEPWVPNHYYVDVMCFLFSKMKQDTRIAFLKEDIKGLNYGDHRPVNRSRVLELFLDWPYQDYFLKAARLMWEFLPATNYFEIIERLTFKIGTRKGYYKYGEDINYDYKELLSEFLKAIPEPNKKYFFRDYKFEHGNDNPEKRSACSLIINQLFCQNIYTNQDKMIVELMLNYATNEEKEEIISCIEGMCACIALMERKRWNTLDEFVSNCYTSVEKARKFKRMLCFEEYANDICIDLITNNELQAFESFIRWSALSDEEINQLKKQMILSEYGRNACLKLISSDKKLKVVIEFISSCISTEEKVIEFKRELLFCPNGMKKCVELLIADQVELANEFTMWSLSSEEEIVQYKKNVANEIGRKICRKLISNVPINRFINNRGVHPVIQFNDGDMCGKVENFLTWCFTSEDEIKDFKKSLTVKNADGSPSDLMRMHLSLMLDNKWKEAEMLFSWLGLSGKEILKLKKETILSRSCLTQINLSVHVHPSNILDSLGGKWKKIDLFLRWCLTNVDDVLEFKNAFDKECGFKSYEDNGEGIPNYVKKNLNQFYLFIEEFCSDFNQQP